MSEDAHKIAFGKVRPARIERIDYALLAVDSETEKPMGYVTCREHDAETVYWQFGGAFPGTKGSGQTFEGCTKLMEWCEGRYKRITGRVENTNLPALHLALKLGFLINGVQHASGTVLLELVKEF